MAKSDQVWRLDQEWLEPLLASWRTLEMTLNPAVYFIMRCGQCGTWTSMEGDQPKGPIFLRSKKNSTIYIGIQCQTCEMAVKFGDKGMNPDEMPKRYRTRPASILHSPKHPKKPAKAISEYLKTIKKSIGL